MKEGKVPLDPQENLVIREKLEFLDSLVPQEEMVYLDQEAYQVFLDLKVILVKMASKEKLVLLGLKDSRGLKDKLGH